MSFCRWSSDDFHCDLYCYVSAEGIITHVAGNRVLGDIPKVPYILGVFSEEWMKAHRAQMDFLKTAKHKHIGLPYDGQSFCDHDYESFLERLLYLREVGYIFGDYVIDAAKEAIERHGEKIVQEG